MAWITSWLVGSTRLAAAATFTINGTPHNLAAGTYYLIDATTAQSLVDEVLALVQLEVAGATAWIGRDRKVHIDFDGTPTTLVVPTALRPLLGLTAGTYGPVTTLDAEAISTLLWSPGWPETTTGSPYGSPGRQVYDRVATASADGRSVNVTYHHTAELLDVSWTAIEPARAWTPALAGGEFEVFRRQVIVPGFLFKFYSEVTEDASTTAVTLPDPLGAYFETKLDDKWYSRFVANTDSVGANLSLSLTLTDDYS